MYSTNPHLVKIRGRRREVTSSMVAEAKRVPVPYQTLEQAFLGQRRRERAYAAQQQAAMAQYQPDRLGKIGAGLGEAWRGLDGRCLYCGR